MERALVVGIFIATIAVGWLWWNRRAAATGAEAQLRRICFDDPRQVERLIEGEMRRASGTMSRAEAARRAVERHRRDNR
jgi:hypothetical protein